MLAGVGLLVVLLAALGAGLTVAAAPFGQGPLGAPVQGSGPGAGGITTGATPAGTISVCVEPCAGATPAGTVSVSP